MTFWKYCLIFWKVWFCFFALMLVCSIMNWLENDGKVSFSHGGSLYILVFMTVMSGFYLLVKSPGMKWIPEVGCWIDWKYCSILSESLKATGDVQKAIPGKYCH